MRTVLERKGYRVLTAGDGNMGWPSPSAKRRSCRRRHDDAAQKRLLGP